VGGLNVIGLSRRGYNREQVHRLRAAFRTLFGRDGVLATRFEETRAAHGDDPLVAEVLEFILAQGKRGLTPANLTGDPETT
jgi:UDP-N-acetylglucosamine acyltransferase